MNQVNLRAAGLCASRETCEPVMITATIGMAEKKKYSKQRHHPRTRPPKDFLVAWQGGGRCDANRARDLSLGGIFIAAIDPLDPGTIVSLLFDAPDGQVRVRAVVRYIRPRKGMGVQFLGMDFTARRRLYAMLKRLMG
jgi:hypothetical protein